MEQLILKKDTEDILTLVRQYIKKADEELDTGHKELSRDAIGYLLSCEWKDNEKELKKAVKRACILSEGHILREEDFKSGYRETRSMGIGMFIEEKLRGFMKNIKNFERFNLYETVIPEVEKALITMVMKETEGNQIKAARLLGINRNTLRNKIKKLKINSKAPNK